MASEENREETDCAGYLGHPFRKSTIGEVFFWPRWYTVSTYKRETEVGSQERKHHENSHFQRRHSHRFRSVGSGTRAHPGGWRTDHACRLVLPGGTPCAALQRVRLRPAWPGREWGHTALRGRARGRRLSRYIASTIVYDADLDMIS